MRHQNQPQLSHPHLLDIIIKAFHSCPYRYQQTNNDGDDDVIIHRKSLMAIYMVWILPLLSLFCYICLYLHAVDFFSTFVANNRINKSIIIHYLYQTIAYFLPFFPRSDTWDKRLRCTICTHITTTSDCSARQRQSFIYLVWFFQFYAGLEWNEMNKLSFVFWTIYSWCCWED